MSKIDKKKLPSRHTSLGPDRAPHRSFYYAMGSEQVEIIETHQRAQQLSEENKTLLSTVRQLRKQIEKLDAGEYYMDESGVWKRK